MNSNESKELDREVELPYEIHQYNLVDARYMTFMAPPTKRFAFDKPPKPHDYNGKWRYKAQWINGYVWVSVDIGVGFTQMDNVQLLKREKDVRIKFAEDWDKIYALAKKVLGV